MRKPDNITFWLNEKPPVQVSLLLALQQMSFLAVYLVVSPLFGRTMGLTHEQSLQLVSATLLASALGVVLQTLRRWGIGSGYFCPLQTTAATFSALAIANLSGNIAALFGAVSVIGLSQMLFAQLFQRLRAIFTIQVAGVSVMLIGLGLGHNGLKLILTPDPGVAMTDSQDGLICALTLCTMLACNVWSSGYLRLFSAFIGLAAGIGASLALGAISADKLQIIRDTPLFYLPRPLHIGWAIDYHSLPAILLTGLFLALHGFGAIVASERFNDADWKRPDLQLLKQGIRAEGLTNVVNSLLNGLPLTSSGGAVSLAAATGCTSRYVAYWLGGLMALIAFMPKVIVFWEILPEPVMGSAMIFLACFTTMAGLQIISSRLLDNRKILAIGVGLTLGLSYEPLKDGWQGAAPDIIKPLLFSGVGLGVMATVLLTSLFRLGDQTRRRRNFDASHSSMDQVVAFLEQQGKSWGARSDVVQKAEYATWQAFELLAEYDLVESDEMGKRNVSLETVFNEQTFGVIIRYPGRAIPLATHPPSHEDMLEDEDAVLQMAGYMLHRLADKASLELDDSGCQMRLVFND